MVKHTQVIPRQIADELCECVWPFCEIGAKRIIKGNQTMKFNQLVEYNKTNISFKNHAENEAGRLVPELFLFFFKKNFVWSKSKWSAS